jgi:hypothetical protein
MSNPSKLLARGVEVTLADGRVARLRFGMRELAELEDLFGSLNGSQEALAGGKTFKSTAQLLAIGLAHEGLTLEQLWDLLIPADTHLYAEAIVDAISQSFPDSDGPGNSEAGTTTGSPSSTGTTSPSSSSAGPSTSSGT